MANGSVDALLDGDDQEAMAGVRKGGESMAQVVLRALQKLDAVSRGPAAALRCTGANAQAQVCRSVEVLCDQLENDIRWLADHRR